MSTRSRQESLREQTRQAYERYDTGRARLSVGNGGVPEPGDVFVLDPPGDFVVGWVVVASDAGRALAVPADNNSLVGSADVEVTDVTSGGPLSLRCRLGTWLGAETFVPQARLGLVDPGDIARVRYRCSEIDDGTFTGSVLALEEDENPDYRDWVSQVLEPARQDLVNRQDIARDDGPERRAQSSRRNFRLLRIAASILLVVGASLAAGLLWRQQAQLERRLQEARLESAVLNPVVAQLKPLAQVRGQVRSFRLPAQASHLVLFLPLGDLHLEETAPTPRYRIELLKKESDQQAWASDELTPQAPGEIRVGLPVSKLEPGEYRLRLLAPENGRFLRIADYGLRIESK